MLFPPFAAAPGFPGVVFLIEQAYALSLLEGRLLVTLLLNEIRADWREVTDEELNGGDPFRSPD